MWGGRTRCLGLAPALDLISVLVWSIYMRRHFLFFFLFSFSPRSMMAVEKDEQ